MPTRGRFCATAKPDKEPKAYDLPAVIWRAVAAILDAERRAPRHPVRRGREVRRASL